LKGSKSALETACHMHRITSPDRLQLMWYRRQFSIHAWSVA